MLTPGAASVTPGAPSGPAYVASQDVKDTIRAQEAKSDAVTDPVEDQEIAKQEADVKHALAMSLGREGVSAGMPPGAAASAEIGDLRKAKIQLRVEAVTGFGGAAISNEFVQLKDSFTDRVQALQTKLASGTASAAERAEVAAGAQQAMKLNNLKMQVGAVSRATLMTNVHVQNGGITTMLKIAGMVTVRKQHGMNFTEDDYARVRRILARQKRWEAMAATTMGMLASYEAVVTGTGDPKALDAIADSSLGAFPFQPEVSDDDAKNYVSHLSDDAASQKAKYEAMMRNAYGDSVYEQRYKTGIDAMFAKASGASSTQSIAQLASSTQDKYQTDLAKCANGEQPGPGSLVGPGKCQEARENALTGGGAGGGGATLTVGGGLGLSGSTSGLKGAQKGANAVQGGVAVASAMAKGDTAGALQGAADMFPGDGPIQNSLQGVAALMKKDYKGALKSAIGLAGLLPGGALIKQGLGMASKILNLFG
jgi:hypothetical protein